MLARRSVTIGVCTFALTFAACAPESTDCPTGYCGNVIGMLYAEASTLFPPIIQLADDQAISNLIFLPLADIGNDLNTTDDTTFQPRLARSWSFEDSLTIVFEMDPRGRWHDGAPVTAHDVAFTFSVYQDTLLGVPSRSSLESLERVTARDDQTVAFEFNRWHREMFYTAVYHMRVVPRHLLDSIPRERLSAHPFATNPVGTGPYRFVRWNPGQAIHLEADTSFFLGRPGFPTIEWQFARDPNTILTPLISEGADILPVITGPENIERARQSDHLNVMQYDINYYGYFAFNLRDRNNRSRPHPLFGDPDVRRAIALAIDRGLVARTAHGETATPPSQPATRVVRVYSEDVPVLDFDPELAKQILADKGWTDSDSDGILDRNGQDFAFRILVPSSSNARRQSAGVIASLLANIGMRVEQDTYEFGVFSQHMINSDFDTYLGSWFVQPSPAGIRGTWTSTGPQNFGGYSNRTVDSLVRIAMIEPDPVREQALWHEIFATMNEDPGAIWIYAPTNYGAIHKRFENVFLRPDQWSATMWQWRVRDGEWLPRDVADR